MLLSFLLLLLFEASIAGQNGRKGLSSGYRHQHLAQKGRKNGLLSGPDLLAQNLRAIDQQDVSIITETVTLGETSTSNISGSFQSTDASAVAETFTVEVIDFNGKTASLLGSSSSTSSTTTVSAENTVIDQTFRGPFVYAVNASNVPLGGLFPLTVGGVANLRGVQFAEYFRCIINIANSNGRILPKTLLTYYIQDSGVGPASAVSQALLLSQRGVPMVVGPETDEQTSIVANLYRDETIPLITYVAAGVQLTNATIYPTFYRAVPSDEIVARAMAETMKLFNWNFVAALFTTDLYGQSGRTALIRQTGRQRIKVTCANSIDPGSTRGLSTFAACVASSDASVVVLWMDEISAANTLSFLYQNATNSRLTFMASTNWAIIEDPLEFNNTAARTNYSFPLSFIKGTLGFFPAIGSPGLFNACMSMVSPENTDYPAFNEVWEREFRCSINSTSEAMPICPSNIKDRGEFPCKCRVNERFDSFSPPPRANYVSDSANVFINTLNTLFNNCYKIQNGEAFCELEYWNSSTINQLIPYLSFNGLTGPIAYNQTKPDRRRSFLDIFQFNDEGEERQVGFWNLTGPYYSKSLLEFKTSPAYPVSSLVPGNTVFGSTFWTTLVPVLAGVLFLLAIFFIVFFTVFADTRVVRRANLVYLLLFLVGICLVCSSMIIWSLVQDTFRCTMKSVVGMLGFGLITACITAKCIRIFRVFLNYGTVSPKMTQMEFFGVVAIIMAIDGILAIIYIIGSGSLPQAKVVQSTSDNTYVYIACVPNTKSYGTWVVGSFMVVNAILMLANAFVLFLGRSLETAYKEADFLFLAVLDFLVLMVLLIPLYYTVGDRLGSVEQSYLLRSLGVLFALSLTFGVVFVPKMVYIMRSLKTQKDVGKTSAAATLTATTTTGTSKKGVRYTEMSSGDSSGSSQSADLSGKPMFISENVSNHD